MASRSTVPWADGRRCGGTARPTSTARIGMAVSFRCTSWVAVTRLRSDPRVWIDQAGLPMTGRVHVSGIWCTNLQSALYDVMRYARGVREAVVMMDMTAAARLISVRLMGLYVQLRPAYTGVPLVRQGAGVGQQRQSVAHGDAVAADLGAGCAAASAVLQPTAVQRRRPAARVPGSSSTRSRAWSASTTTAPQGTRATSKGCGAGGALPRPRARVLHGRGWRHPRPRQGGWSDARDPFTCPLRASGPPPVDADAADLVEATRGAHRRAPGALGGAPRLFT